MHHPLVADLKTSLSEAFGLIPPARDAVTLEVVSGVISGRNQWSSLDVESTAEHNLAGDLSCG